MQENFNEFYLLQNIITKISKKVRFNLLLTKIVRLFYTFSCVEKGTGNPVPRLSIHLNAANMP